MKAMMYTERLASSQSQLRMSSDKHRQISICSMEGDMRRDVTILSSSPCSRVCVKLEIDFVMINKHRHAFHSGLGRHSSSLSPSKGSRGIFHVE